MKLCLPWCANPFGVRCQQPHVTQAVLGHQPRMGMMEPWVLSQVTFLRQTIFWWTCCCPKCHLLLSSAAVVCWQGREAWLAAALPSRGPGSLWRGRQAWEPCPLCWGMWAAPVFPSSHITFQGGCSSLLRGLSGCNPGSINYVWAGVPGTGWWHIRSGVMEGRWWHGSQDRGALTPQQQWRVKARGWWREGWSLWGDVGPRTAAVGEGPWLMEEDELVGLVPFPWSTTLGWPALCLFCFAECQSLIFF